LRRDNCIKRDLEIVEGEWRTTAKDRRIWRLRIESVYSERKVRGEDKAKDDGNHDQPHP